MEYEDKNVTDFIVNESTYLGFICIICNSSHTIKRMREANTPICIECLNDLSEIILEKRGKAKTNVNLETIGMQADRLDNIVATLTHGNPPGGMIAIHTEQLPHVLKSISNDLKQAVIAETGEDPWK